MMIWYRFLKLRMKRVQREIKFSIMADFSYNTKTVFVETSAVVVWPYKQNIIAIESESGYAIKIDDTA